MAAKNDILAEAQRIFKVVRQRAASATFATIEQTALNLMSRLDGYRKYQHVTGNTWTSTTIGIFYKGELKALYNKGAEDEAPMRVTLKKGEDYDLVKVYKGEETVGYKGEYGEGGQWGPTLGPEQMQHQHVAKRKTWSLVVMIPVEYANYNPRIVATMQNIMDGIPEVLNWSVVTIDKEGAQSTMFNGNDDLPF